MCEGDREEEDGVGGGEASSEETGPRADANRRCKRTLLPATRAAKTHAMGPNRMVEKIAPLNACCLVEVNAGRGRGRSATKRAGGREGRA